ncbi:MAG: bifunctional adenosylcobinamide kinase/adenosylcobinamide-phosphate guanylyltransferase, partial [Bacteroidales bacterium]|nr:bifunctional adenosylcobinamide kinase/adenosylcobinamide-phosphate guanylyltransferase [Bacteroidales bacterium]
PKKFHEMIVEKAKNRRQTATNILPILSPRSAWKATCAIFVFVTNEIGLCGVPENRVQRQFTDLLGWLNQYIASRADEVIFMVSGIPMKIK